MLAGVSLLWNAISLYRVPPQPVIKIGILHSQTGSTAITEIPVANATLLAIQEINYAGGLLGRPLDPIVVDGKSDVLVFAREAKRLVEDNKVDVVFGCWTSASRKTVAPILEKHKRLLFYSVQYEGLEKSPNVVSTGSVPNQQALPATFWCMKKFGKRIFLAGSDYIFPRAANAIIKEFASYLDAEIVGEEYLPLGMENAASLVQKIIAAKPDFILNTLNGSTNIHFFQELNASTQYQNAGKRIPVMSLSVDDSLARAIGINNVAGSYTCWNYYESLPGIVNKKFVQKIKNAYGKNQVITDPMDSAYLGMHVWAEAVKRAGTTEMDAVLESLKETTFRAPDGFVSVDSANHNTINTVRIAQFSKDPATGSARSDVIWAAHQPTVPVAYPSNLYIVHELLGKVRSVSDWDKFLYYLYLGWGKQWEAP